MQRRQFLHLSAAATMIFPALVEAIAYSGFAAEHQFDTPPENNRRKVFVYTRIDIDKMKSDWWNVIEKAISSKSIGRKD